MPAAAGRRGEHFAEGAEVACWSACCSYHAKHTIALAEQNTSRAWSRRSLRGAHEGREPHRPGGEAVPPVGGVGVPCTFRVSSWPSVLPARDLCRIFVSGQDDDGGSSPKSSRLAAPQRNVGQGHNLPKLKWPQRLLHFSAADIALGGKPTLLDQWSLGAPVWRHRTRRPKVKQGQRHDDS